MAQDFLQVGRHRCKNVCGAFRQFNGQVAATTAPRAATMAMAVPWYRSVILSLSKDQVRLP
jgi:hypothetical protein